MPTFTLETLERRVWDHLDSNEAFYPEANVRGCLNQGLRRLNSLVGFKQSTVAIPGFSVANQLIYAVPSQILIPINGYFEKRELVPSSLRSLAHRHRNWATETTRFSGPTSHWAPIGMTQFVIHPMDAFGGGLIEVQGVAPITPLVNQGDFVELNDEFVDILIDYARSRAMLKEFGQPFSTASVAYQQMIRDVKAHLLFQDMVFPAYWIAKEQPGQEAREGQ